MKNIINFEILPISQEKGKKDEKSKLMIKLVKIKV
jgi:hypothetical protein